MNSLFVINPYKLNGAWVFDDDSKNIVREPFVCGAEKVMEHLSSGKDSFNLSFSANVFPNYDVCCIKVKDEFGGAWYDAYVKEGLKFEIWLCPKLTCYINPPPQYLYGKVI